MPNWNSKKNYALISISLIALCFMPLCFGRIGEPAPSSSVNAPGMPSDAARFDLSDMTPMRDVEHVNSRLMHVFAYRNVTLMFNSSRNCELNITVDSAVKPRILALSVEPNQNLQLTMNMRGVPLSGEQVMARTLDFYLGIEPNATVVLQAQIRLHINATELNQELNRVINASRLTWMYWNQTNRSWVPVESYMDQNGYLVCNTTHFSTWTVAETNPVPSATPTPLPSPTNAPAPSTTATVEPSPTLTPSPLPSELPPSSPSASPVPSQTPLPVQSPSPSSSPAPEQESSSGFFAEYLYVIIVVAVCAVAAVSVVLVKKKAK